MNHSEIGFLCLLIIIFFSFFRRKERIESTPTLGHRSTEQLKGIAIVLVVFGHLCANGFIDIPVLKYSGAQGVTIFLVLSGFGLTKSFMKKGIDDHFFVRRFKSVFVPYLIVTVVLVALDYITQRYTIPKNAVLSSLVGLNMQVDPTMWYISFIFLWYLAFYVIFNLKVKNAIKILLLLIFSCVIKFNVASGSDLLNAPYEYSLHAFAFPVGVAAALYTQKVMMFFKSKRLQISLLSFISVLIFIGFLMSFKRITIEHQTMYTIINFMLSISLIITVVLLGYLRRESKLLAILGKYSYEIYLFEAVFFTRYDFLHRLSNKWISLLLYVFMLLLFSFLLHSITKLMFSRRMLSREKSVLKV